VPACGVRGMASLWETDDRLHIDPTGRKDKRLVLRKCTRPLLQRGDRISGGLEVDLLTQHEVKRAKWLHQKGKKSMGAGWPGGESKCGGLPSLFVDYGEWRLRGYMLAGLTSTPPQKHPPHHPNQPASRKPAQATQHNPKTQNPPPPYPPNPPP